MRTAGLSLALIAFCALSSSAGTITHVDPGRFPASEMEMFITVHGHDLAGHRTYAIYDGPAGHFEVQTQGGDATRQYVWLPGEIGRTPGVYSIVLDAYNYTDNSMTRLEFAGRSGPGSFEVTGSAPPPENRPPIIQTSGDISAEATGPNGAVINFQVTVSSTVDPNLQATCTRQPNTYFDVGTTAVTCSATDSFGTAMTTFNVTVRDTTPPEIVGLLDVTVVTTSSAGVAITYDARAMDLVDPNPVLVCGPSSGSVFPVGQTTVRCSAYDLYNNSSTRTAVFTVRLDAPPPPPTLDLPEDMTVEANTLSGAYVHFQTSATCLPASGSVFAIGTTTVNCTAGSASGSFRITVRDTTPPIIMVPEALTYEITDPGGLIVRYDVMTSDVADPSPMLVCSPASGSIFPLGVNPVNCTSTDDSGNVGTNQFFVIVRLTGALPDITAEARSAAGAVVTFEHQNCSPASGSTFPLGTTDVQCSGGSFRVIVQDTTAPNLRLPDTIHSMSQVVTYEITATDLVDATPTVACSPASGSTFPYGSTTVSCSATDDAGNTATGTFQVIVTAPPVPGDVIAEATSPAGAVVTFDGSDCSPASGSTFPLGTTTVQCSGGSFTVTVRDTTAPALQLPADITSSSQVVTYTVAATDLVDSTPSVSCSPASGSTFPYGTTTVSCLASDDFGNTANGSFQVTVTPPTLNVPADMIVEASSLDGAVVNFTVTASDGAPVMCSPASGTLFPFGTTAVSCTSGTAQGSFNVTVRDSLAPVVHNISATPNHLWPPNHQMERVAVTVDASDLPGTATTARITGVVANEDITGDWLITGPLTVELRAERLGELSERTYTIVVEVLDHVGNATTARVDVRVAQMSRPRASRR